MKTLCLAGLCMAVGLWAQAPEGLRETVFEDRPAVAVSNGALELTVALQGGAFAKLVRPGAPDPISPLWDPARAAREARQPARTGASLGHFVCVDGFGASSAQERAAGLSSHGEAHLQTWDIVSSAKDGAITTLKLRAKLPLVQEVFTRTIRMADGENVVYVNSQLESLLAFDRPISWAEHATIGTPFLEKGATVLDVSAGRSTTRPYDAGSAKGRRLASGKEFPWPMAPARDGSKIDLRGVPETFGSNDIVTTALDPSREYAFVTAINLRRRLVFGYIFRPAEYPWLQDWEHFPDPVTMARGMEFSTQPFGLPRREVVEMHSLLGRPAFRWLPAKSTIESTFVMFYASVPAGFDRVSEVKLEGGKLVLESGRPGLRVALAASLLK